MKIAVCGLGFSIGLYKPEYGLSIGVNDIWSKVQTDYIVCVDKRIRFTPERLKIIDESKPIKFFTQYPEKDHLELMDWRDRNDYCHIELQPNYPDYICQLGINQLPQSHCSPFIACAIAFNYFHATEIHLFGVDMINHPHLHGGTLESIKLHFKNLKIALRQNGCELIIHGNGILKYLNN